MSPQPVWADDGGLSFTILHTNDLHSHEEPFRENGRTQGGVARLAHLIKYYKARATRPVLVIDAGDIFQGTPFFEQYKGEAEVECLNKMGYDIFAVGNHEFDEGSDNLATQLSKAKFDVISANLDVSSHAALQSIVKPSVVKVINGQKVAFVGAITPALSTLANKLGGVKLKAVDAQWTEPIKTEVERLKAQGIDKIIVVSHCGVDSEKQLAEAVPEIDAIIGGHSHTRLEKPVYIKRKDGSECIDVQTGCYGRALGRLDLSFNKSGEIEHKNSHYRLINITDRIWEDPTVKEYVDTMGKPFASLKTTIVGKAEANFDNKFARYQTDSPIGDLICDAMADAGKDQGATISLQNRGGIRARIEQGPISLEKVREVLPFDNRLVFATIDGAVLLENLENSVSGMLGARFLDVSGLKLVYDREQPQGKRVVFLLARGKDGKWAPVTPSGSYRIAINSYSFGGGEGYNFPGAKNIVETGRRTSVYLQAYLEKMKTVQPALPDRLLEVTDKQAWIERDNLIVKAPTGALVTIVGGKDQGIEFVKKIGTVPVAQPQILRETKKIESKPNLSLPVSQLRRKDVNFVTAVIKIRDDKGTTRRVSYPVDLSQAATPGK